MCNENTKHFRYKYYGLFVRMYITSQQSYLSQINTRQTSFEAYFDSKRKSRDSAIIRDSDLLKKVHEQLVAFIPKVLCCFAGH